MRVNPNVRFAVVTLGLVFTVSHHHPPGQSLSWLQPRIVQKAFASAGLCP